MSFSLVALTLYIRASKEKVVDNFKNKNYSRTSEPPLYQHNLKID